MVIGTSLTFSLYLKGAQMIGGPKASILSCAEPLSSALLSLLLLGITFTLPDWLGTLLILSSVVLIHGFPPPRQSCLTDSGAATVTLPTRHRAAVKDRFCRFGDLR